jgi:hypothetical protein
MSNCPQGGTHALTGSRNYALAHNVGAGQTSWRWCNKCQGLWFGPNQAMSSCPQGGEHALTGSGNYRIPIVTSGVRVHVKVLTWPNILIATLFQNMREVYATCNVDVQWATLEVLNLPALNIVDVNGCNLQTTSEQNQLFNNRNFVGSNEIVVYFVRATNPPFNGCAAHPASRPGSVVVQTATQWTFTHEQGHVLGLNHVNNNDRLMTGNGTVNITNARVREDAGKPTHRQRLRRSVALMILLAVVNVTILFQLGGLASWAHVSDDHRLLLTSIGIT